MRELILELCHEAGDTGTEDDIVKGWEGDHGCCCMLNAEMASQGSVSIVNEIRGCMGLPVPR